MDYFNCLIFLIILKCSSSAKIPIAGFFHTGDAEQELVFKLAVENVNHIIQDNNYGEEKVFLEERIEHVSSFDSYNISRRVCDLTNEGIGGIFGPQSLEAVGITESLCDSMEIPMIKTFWDISSMPSRSAINLYPDPNLLAKALVAVVNDMDWNKYTIIYENNDGLIRLQELLKSHKRSFTSEGHVPFTVWQLDPNTRDLRPLLKEIQRTSESHIVLDCSTERIIDILKQAKEVKMLGDYHSYVLTSLDAHTLDYSDLQLETTNITTLRLINPQSHYVQSTVQDWVFFHKTLLKDNLQLTADTLKTEAALTYDAIKVYSEALQRVQKELPEEMEVMPLQCSNSEKWYHGSIINNEMKKIIVEGMTGTIKFDEEGRRSFFTLDITELTKNGFRKIGQWDPEKGISYTRTESQMKQEMYKSISNKTFMVVSRLGRPYLSEVDPSLEGNARYEGYSMDLIDEIAKDLNFKYKFYLAPDGAYGSFNKDTKQWNGLIKELRERKADLAICDLTITYERRSAVDFTMPFMNLGISILYSKPTKQPPDLFSFLSPFSIDVWTYMATAYLGVSLLLYFLARCTPDEWDNPHPCDPDPTELECIFSLHNCLWFSIGSLMAQGCDLLPKISPMEWKNPHPCKPDPDELENALPIYNAIWHNIGSLMQQGSDIAPQALSTRVVAGMWWFFVLIMISSYTANLAAFLTMDRMEATIESVEDLANQNKIKYGVMQGGSSANFFRDSNTSLYQKIWSQMDSARPSVFTKNNDEGVDRVLRGKRGYAFFMESTTIEYQKEKHCNKLMQVGGLLDSKGYGIAMPFHSPYRIAISGSVLKMQESGKLLALKDKWWKGESKCIVEDKEEADSSELGIENVGGVFLVLAVGCVVGFFVSILEFLWNVRKVAVEEKISPGEAFLLELKFAIQCYGTTKPVRKPREGSVVEEDFAECVEEHVEEEEEDRGFFGDENMEEEYIRLNGFSNNIRAKSTQSYS